MENQIELISLRQIIGHRAFDEEACSVLFFLSPIIINHY